MLIFLTQSGNPLELSSCSAVGREEGRREVEHGTIVFEKLPFCCPNGDAVGAFSVVFGFIHSGKCFKKCAYSEDDTIRYDMAVSVWMIRLNA